MQNQLYGLRKGHNETQKDLARLLSISEGAYRNKENGKAEFKMSEMFMISDHYGIPIDQIFLPRKYTKC